MKTKKQWLFITLPLLLLTLIGALALTGWASETDTEQSPAVSIDKFNLQFNENVQILYAVSLTGVDPNTVASEDFGMLFWTAPNDTWEMGTEELSLPTSGGMLIDDEEYFIFEYKELAAKQMTDDVYARAYLRVGEELYYSNVEKYSVLQYAYNMLGKTGTPTDSETLKALLNDMLTYGASAQLYFNYNTDRLATDDYYQICVENGTIASDGSTCGLYHAGETVELTAAEEITVITDAGEETVNFSHWENASEEIVSEDLTHTVTVSTTNAAYTAVYDTPDSYFVFTEITTGDNAGTYSVKAADVNNMPEKVVIPATYNGIGVTTLSNNAFQYSTIKKAFVPNGVTSIGNEAFSNCSKLTNIKLPNSIASIGNYTFIRCSSLTNITIPDSVTSIGDHAFYYCSSLTNITIPDSVTSIGYSAFEYCSNLRDVYISNVEAWLNISSEFYSPLNYYGTLHILDKNGEEVTELVIPEGVTSIGKYTFYNCTNLTSVTIPEGVTSIGVQVFYNCSNLTNITIPEGVTSIGVQVFYNCSNLTNITIPDSVTNIGNSAFYNCTSLTSVTIPKGVTSIGDEAFYGCSSLTNITIPESVTSIGYSAFYGCSSLTNITIPEGVTSISHHAFVGCDQLTSIAIPSSVTSIGYSAFYGCSNLTNIMIPEGVTSIGGDAFRDCSSLTNITIPKGVTSISTYTFKNCTSLTGITIPDSVTSIGAGAFSGCSNLTSVTIPEGVTSIGNSVFSGCSNLTSVTIPEGVTSIGTYAFASTCLTTVYYTGTAEEWPTITIESSNAPLTNATIYYYSETEPALNADGTAYDGNYWYYDENGQPVIWVLTTTE